MIYVVLFFIVLIVLASGVSFYMYIQDRRRTRSARTQAPKREGEIPSYKLSSWIDDEVAIRKLYQNTDSSAADLANKLGISKRRLIQTINSAYNKTVAEYLDDRRIQAACSLLREQPEMTLDEISFETGFASLKTFRTVFKNTMGQTPEQYRIMITQQKNKLFPLDTRSARD